MKRFLALFLALIMIVGLVACGGKTEPASSEPTQPAVESEPKNETPEAAPEAPAESETPAEPKVLTYAVYTAASNGCALIATGGTDGTLTEMIAGCLYGYLPVDGQELMSPVLADGEPVDVNGDGMTWNIKIHPDAKFSNGEPINADTFMYTFQQAIDPVLCLPKATSMCKNYCEILNATAYYTQASTGVAVAWEDVGFKKVDDMTIQVITAQPTTALILMRQLAQYGYAPLYQPLWEECLSADKLSTTYGSSPDKLMTAGPFNLTNWVVGNVREFEKNENYIRSDLVKLDKVVQLVVSDINTRVQMFESGETLYTDMGVDALELYGDDPRVIPYPGRNPFQLEFNTGHTTKTILANENFRLALYYSVNREEIAKICGHDPATGVIGYKRLIDAEGTTFREVADAAGYLPTVEEAYNPELAKEYYAKALEEEGLDSLELMLRCASDEEEHKLISEYLQETWLEMFDLKLTIESEPGAQMRAKVKNWKENPDSYEIAIMFWDYGAGDFDPINSLNVFTTSYNNRNAPYGVDFIEEKHTLANEEYPLDMEKRVEIAMEIEEYMVEHAIVVPLMYKLYYGMVADNLILPYGGYSLNGGGWGLRFADIAQ